MASTKLYLMCLGCSILGICIMNLILVVRHLSFATVSLSTENEGYNLSVQWKIADANDANDNAKSGSGPTSRVEGIVAAGMAGPNSGGDSKPRSPNTTNRRGGPNGEKKKIWDTEKKEDKDKNKNRDKNKGKNKDKNKNEDKDDKKDQNKNEKKDNDKTENHNKDKNKDKDKDKDKDKNKDNDKGGNKGKKKKNKNKAKKKGDSVAGVVDAIGSGNSTTAFSRHERVAIVTKIQGDNQWGLLVQSMCLLHHAYNHKVLYDIIVFSTESVSQEKIKSIGDMLSPAKFRLVVDNKGLQEEFADLSQAKKDNFLKMCNATDPSELTWWSMCDGNRLAYNWQAEFRSIRLWHHPAMAEYETMMWLDTDGFATKAWEKDPVDYFIRNKGVIMFDHFPQAKSKYWVQERIFKAFNSTICRLKLSEETGNLVPELGTGDRCMERGVPNIHGFFHITDLGFFRSEIVTEGLATIHGDCFLCRFPDDQLAVTAPTAVLQPERSWEMRGKGFHLGVYHNQKLDGIDQAVPAGFKTYWGKFGKSGFPTAYNVCKVTESQ